MQHKILVANVTKRVDHNKGTVEVNSVTGANGTTVTCKATARTGYRFVGWYDENGNLLSSNDTYNTSILSDKDGITYYARFEKIPPRENGSQDNQQGEKPISESKPTEIYLAKNPSVTAGPAPTWDTNRMELYIGLLLLSFFGIGLRIYKKHS